MTSNQNKNTTTQQTAGNGLSLSIFIHRSKAAAFACTKCGDIPRKSMNNEDGDIMCAACAQESDEAVTHMKGVQNMIGNLQIACTNNDTNTNTCNDSVSDAHFDDPEDHKSEEGNQVLITGRGEDPVIDDSKTLMKKAQCEWNGKLKHWPMHNKNECEFALISCANCVEYECIRKCMQSHWSMDCAQYMIDCTLECGQRLKRAQLQAHLQNECPLQIKKCTNSGCNAWMERQLFAEHADERCQYRLVVCPYWRYGCRVNADGKVAYLMMESHLQNTEVKHLQIHIAFLLSNNDTLKRETTEQTNEIQHLSVELSSVKEQLTIAQKDIQTKSQELFSLQAINKELITLQILKRNSDLTNNNNNNNNSNKNGKRCLSWERDEEAQRKCEFISDTKVKVLGMSVALCDYVIKASNYVRFEWEIVIDKLGCFSYLGFVNAPNSKSMPRSFVNNMVFFQGGTRATG